MYRQQKLGAPFKPFSGLSGITRPLLLVQKLGVKAAVSWLPRTSYVPATKAGCPIQAVFWLEWDNTPFAPGTGTGCESRRVVATGNKSWVRPIQAVLA